MSTAPSCSAPATRLAAEGVTLAHGETTVARDLSLAVPDGQVTAIVGANACGKSTLLRSLARLLRPTSGAVTLDGRAITELPTKEVARRLALLPQSPIAPAGILVGDLVARGRSPHQRFLRSWSAADERAVAAALEATSTTDLADRCVDELSGGQRQRVWIAMALAQDTGLLLLDEPTTFLDIAHQVDVLDLVDRLNREQGRTVVLVLHDLNLAARYASHLVAMRDGQVVAAGPPEHVVTPGTVREVFGLECLVVPDPVCGIPMVVPVGGRGAALRAARAAGATVPATPTTT